ncbi:MAG: branched-chain amino acid ABC transporter substrate-binding protein [Nitrospiraceae bacterium]|nr:branched-chain amino acid ABC transporter substrate-binding protein [Nitrospiraceae bacterium]
MKRVLFLLALSIVVVAFLPACKKSEESIKIGVAGPMTGPEAKMGLDFRNGVAVAVEEWNSKGGVLGKKIEIISGDDVSDPKQAVSVARKLVNSGVVAVIGHFDSNCSIPASDIYNAAAIPMITPATTNPRLTSQGYKGIFRVCGTDDQQGKIAADFVSRKLKLKKVAVLHNKTTYGQGLADEFKNNLGSGVQVVYYGAITQGEKDFKPVLTAIRALSAELIYFGGIYNEAGLLVKQARELGMNQPFMSGDGTIDPKFIEIAGAQAAEGTYLTFGPDPNNIPAAKEFISKYKAKHGELGPYSIYAYEAMNILLSAIKAAAATEGKAVIEKLHSTEFSGAMGNIKFVEKGDVQASPFVVWVTKNGRFVEHWKP